MSTPVTRVPQLHDLKARLTDPDWIRYYKKYDCYLGPSESIEYLVKFLKDLAKSS